MTNVLSQLKENRFGISSMSMHDICKRLGIHYSGDVSLDYGGMFYDLFDWSENGYGNAVSVSIDDGHVFIDVGSINRPKDIAACLRCCGWSIDDETGDIVSDSGDVVAEKSSSHFNNVVVESVFAYCGIDAEQSKVCKLHTVYTGNGSDYFVDGGKRVCIDDLRGYILSQYVIPNIQRA